MDIEAVFNAEFEKVYSFFYRKTFHEHLAQDLTSQTFLRFAERSRGVDVRDPRSFLYGISKNIWLEYLREKYRSSEFVADLDELAEEPIPQANLTSFDEGEMVKFVNQLPEKQRIVIELKYVNNLSMEDIAFYTGKDANYIKTTHRRAIISLRKMLGGES